MLTIAMKQYPSHRDDMFVAQIAPTTHLPHPGQYQIEFTYLIRITHGNIRTAPTERDL